MRGLISAFVALVFAIAIVPGGMAMSAPPAMKHTMSMDCSGKAAPGCHHMKPPSGHGTPCKTMAACVGMASCFGMAAVAADRPLYPIATADVPVRMAQQAVSGLNLQPDNRPPIA